ncbi:MAG: beta-propeller fold lactonase family protein [Acidobacteriota bacterium]|nr:beta-propeller fold lactonase family protein [Acidobacteriota bacterium]
MSRNWEAHLPAALLAFAASAVLYGLIPAPNTVVAATSRTGEHLQYASPIELAFSHNGRLLYVLCQGTDELRVLDGITHTQLKKIAVGHLPRGFAFSPDGSRIFVANSWDDTISVIDTKTQSVDATWSVGAEPSSVAEDPSGHFLFVADRISNDVAVLDAKTGAEQKRLAAGRGASYMTLSPDGSRLYVSHVYHNTDKPRTAPHSEITVIDTNRGIVDTRISLPYIAHGFHVAFSTDGRVGALAEMHPKNLVPLAHLEHGGAFADTLTLFGADVGPKPVEVPLDNLEQYAARPFGVAITPDKSKLFVTCGGSEAVLAIDLERLLAYIHMHKQPFTEDLSASGNYVVARITVGHDPRGVTLTPDGKQLLVANRLEDTISVIDTHSNRLVQTISLEGPKRLSVLRHGEQTFYSAKFSFQGQIGCANCHIDSTFDGLQWDLEPDGFGRDIVDNRPIEDLKGTEPYKWNGTNPNLPTECGPRTEKYFWRSETFDDLTLTDLVTYIRSIPARPNRWRLPNGEFTPAQERGKEIFERSVDRFGKPIAETDRCNYCHSGPKGTDQKRFNVGTKKPTDDTGLFDTPQLTNIALSAPYLHDGSATTLEEIWTIYNPHDKHGRTNDLTKDELNDLIEYLRTR